MDVGRIIGNSHFYIVLMGTLEVNIFSYGGAHADIVVMSKISNSTRDYFDATASNWNTSAQSRPLASLCIKTGRPSQIGGWVSSSLDHVIRGGPISTPFLYRLVEQCA